ncbi:hypothetical protein B0H67DRAFT_549003 [Lasiosphaeris hirsuta]|uniref:Uncharacterized protein n=1 Tax=Lasiosphaeris hirsuta TaxID=260670 RepID=A0AA40E7J8_9PEZI|nr:hypothetical protein B0H67DRAFT_549003 [Lasiosphaeris hirsuta]
MSDMVWLITGASSGFGKAIALEALRRGHKVVATARNSAKLSDVKQAGAAIMDLDVTSDEETLTAKLAGANAIYGKITHVANAAGYLLEGTIEEASNKEVFDTFNTNVFGTFNIARASAPHLRAAAAASPGRSVALATFGSIGSWRSGPAVAHYCSTKWAVSGLTEGLREELAPFSIDVTVVEPGYVRTGFLSRDGGDEHRFQTARHLEDVYGEGTEAAAHRAALQAYNRNQPGDVNKCASVIVDVLTKEGVGKGKEVPLRLVLGTDAYETIKGKCDDTLKLLADWEHVIKSTMRDDA